MLGFDLEEARQGRAELREQTLAGTEAEEVRSEREVRTEDSLAEAAEGSFAGISGPAATGAEAEGQPRIRVRLPLPRGALLLGMRGAACQRHAQRCGGSPHPRHGHYLMPARGSGVATGAAARPRQMRAALRRARRCVFPNVRTPVTGDASEREEKGKGHKKTT